MAENIPNMAREKDIQTEDIQRTPKRATTRHIIIKLSKTKRILRAARENYSSHTREPL